MKGKFGRRLMLINTVPLSVRAAPSWHEDVIFLLDDQLCLQDVNDGWCKFAMANSGCNLSLSAIKGTPILSYTPQVLEGFYLVNYEHARRSRKPVSFQYDCSSPEKIRLIRMEISSIGTSLLVVNHVLLEEPCVVREAEYSFDEHLYLSGEEILTMCANCRKTRRVDLPDKWEWVPEFLQNQSFRVSHGLCPRCIKHFYAAPIARG